MATIVLQQAVTIHWFKVVFCNNMFIYATKCNIQVVYIIGINLAWMSQAPCVIIQIISKFLKLGIWPIPEEEEVIYITSVQHNLLKPWMLVINVCIYIDISKAGDELCPHFCAFYL